MTPLLQQQELHSVKLNVCVKEKGAVVTAVNRKDAYGTAFS